MDWGQYTCCFWTMRRGAEPAIGSAQGTRYVTDMAGRKVALPKQVKRIVTLGPVPVLNSFIFALGEGERIVNGLTLLLCEIAALRVPRTFSPRSLAHEPDLQGSGGGQVDIEALLKRHADVIFAMDRLTTDCSKEKGLQWSFFRGGSPRM